MEMVKIVHPEAGEALVPASAVPHWRSSGWEPAAEVELEQDGEAAEKAAEEPKKETPRRGRADSKKEER